LCCSPLRGSLRQGAMTPYEGPIIDERFCVPPPKARACSRQRKTLRSSVRVVKGQNVRSSQESPQVSPLWKTRLCSFHKMGACKNGASCSFAHGEQDLFPSPDFERTSVCPVMLRFGQCDRPGCRYAHAGEELRTAPGLLKTKMCSFFQKGDCVVGEACRFAHRVEELYLASEVQHRDKDAALPALPTNAVLVNQRRRAFQGASMNQVDTTATVPTAPAKILPSHSNLITPSAENGSASPADPHVVQNSERGFYIYVPMPPALSLSVPWQASAGRVATPFAEDTCTDNLRTTDIPAAKAAPCTEVIIHKRCVTEPLENTTSNVSPQNATSIGACDPALNDGDLNQLLSDTAVAPLPKTLASAEHKLATNFVSASDIRPPPGLPHPALGSNDSPSGNERKKGASPCRTRALSQPAHRKKLRATRTPGAAKPKAVLANHGVVDIEDCDAVPEMLSRGSPLEAVPLVPVHRRGRLKMRRREVSHSRAAASAGSRPPSPSQSSAAQAPGASATLSSQNTTTTGSKASSHPAVPEPPQESASRRPQLCASSLFGSVQLQIWMRSIRAMVLRVAREADLLDVQCAQGTQEAHAARVNPV